MVKTSVWKLNLSDHARLKIQPVALSSAPHSLNSASRFLPEGVYTTFRTYGVDRILPIDDHIRRLVESARLVGYSICLDKQDILMAVRQAVSSTNHQDDLRIRLSLDLSSHPGDLYLSFESLQIPSIVEYEKGVATVTFPYQRQNPQSKQTAFIHTAETIRSQLPAGIHEILLLDEKSCILEGLTSNFFAVKQNDLWTAGAQVLSGITRSLVLEAAAMENILVHLDSISVQEIPWVQEAFITSSSRSILPVRTINERIVNGGSPGPVTRRLSQAFWREIDARLVEI